MNQYKVMIVDDEELILDEMESIVDWESHGFKIVSKAKDGETALALYKRIRPQLIISDICMPQMTGLELLNIINEKYPGQSIFVLLSAFGEFSYAQEALRHNAFEYLLKPVMSSDLSDTLRRVWKAIDESFGKYIGMESDNQAAGTSAVKEVIRIISEDYQQKIMISDIASKLNINSNYLGNLFKEKTGLSFSNYLIEYRLNKAIELRKYTEFTWHEISEKVGYTDYYQFSKIFKKHKNMGPNEYGKTIKK